MNCRSSRGSDPRNVPHESQVRQAECRAQAHPTLCHSLGDSTRANHGCQSLGREAQSSEVTNRFVLAQGGVYTTTCILIAGTLAKRCRF